MRFINNLELLNITREFNRSLNLKKNKNRPLDVVAGPWVDKIIEQFPREVTQWKSLDGKLVEDPLEIRMLALSLLLDTWLTDIFLRKARDRSNPGMLRLLEDYWDVLQSNHNFILRYILVEQDPKAVRAYQKAKRGAK